MTGIAETVLLNTVEAGGFMPVTTSSLMVPGPQQTGPLHGILKQGMGRLSGEPR